MNQRGNGQFNRSCDSHMTIYLGVIVDDCVTHYVIAGRPGERERPPPPMVVLCREREGGGGGGGEGEKNNFNIFFLFHEISSFSRVLNACIS